jgi:hypothetical protein
VTTTRCDRTARSTISRRPSSHGCCVTPARSRHPTIRAISSSTRALQSSRWYYFRGQVRSAKVRLDWEECPPTRQTSGTKKPAERRASSLLSIVGSRSATLLPRYPSRLTVVNAGGRVCVDVITNCRSAFKLALSRLELAAAKPSIFHLLRNNSLPAQSGGRDAGLVFLGMTIRLPANESGYGGPLGLRRPAQSISLKGALSRNPT